MKHETASVFLRSGAGWTFASIKPQGETNDNRYVWAKIEKKERQAILWGPDVKKFKALVQDGMIPGKAQDSDKCGGGIGTERKDMKRILQIITTPLVGIVIVMSGFVYDVLFAGIPYQDPTPELQARYDFHSAVASWFYTTGGTLFLAGLLAIPIILKRTKPQ